MSIGTLIKTIQDIMRKDVGVDGDAQRISQIVWLLFLKIFDDKEQEWQLTIPGYKSPLQSRFRWSNWAKNAEGITGEELIDFVNNELFPSLKKLATAAGVTPHGKVVGSVFEDAYNYMKSGTLLRQVINTIEDDVDFNSSTDRHLFNDIYEKILADLQSAGNAGEYYTPRAVTQFMVDILDPQLGESVLDPACGTGGFLTCTIEHLKAQVKTAADRLTLQDSIHGVEKKPLPHMLAMTNLMLHGIDVPSNIRHDNTLSRPLKDYGPKDRVDIILTNPPFGGMEEDGIENNFPRKYQTRETADLFMALIMHLLKHDTGRAAVVLPDGFLFGEGTKTTLKRELLEEFNLHTIVRLPRGVFSPYTNIATNLLFIEKGSATQDVWFFEHPYPQGYKTYSRSRPLTISEFDIEKNWWGGPTRAGRKATQNAWKVSAEEIAANGYNLDIKNPHVQSVDHGDPDTVRDDLGEAIKSMSETQGKLLEELMRAVGLEKQKSLEQHLDSALAAPNAVKTIRELVLRLAIQGKLVKQDPRDIPVEQLLKDVALKKGLMSRDGKGRTKEPLLGIVDSETPFELPPSWQWVRLGEITEIVRGITFPASEKTREPAVGRIGCLRTANVQKEIEWDDLLFIDESYVKKQSQIIRKHDIVMSMANSRELVGKVAIIREEPSKRTTFGGFLGVIRTHEILPLYILILLTTEHARKSLIDSASQTTNIANISLAKLNPFPIPVPPLSEQYRIVEKVGELMNLCDAWDRQDKSIACKRTELLNAVMAQL